MPIPEFNAIKALVLQFFADGQQTANNESRNDMPQWSFVGILVICVSITTTGYAQNWDGGGGVNPHVNKFTPDNNELGKRRDRNASDNTPSTTARIQVPAVTRPQDVRKEFVSEMMVELNTWEAERRAHPDNDEILSVTDANNGVINRMNSRIEESSFNPDLYLGCADIYSYMAEQAYYAQDYYLARAYIKKAIDNSQWAVKKADKADREDYQIGLDGIDAIILGRELGAYVAFDVDSSKLAKFLIADKKYKMGKDGRTHCNEFVRDFVATFVGKSLPELDNDKLANQQADNLVASTRWKELSSESLGAVFRVAQDTANHGGVVVIVWRTPQTGEHSTEDGHIAMIVKGTRQPSADWHMWVPTIAQAGKHNFASDKLSRGFYEYMKSDIKVFVLTQYQ